MHSHTHQETGVLGVLGVPKSLQATPNRTYSHGTPNKKSRNTKLQEHQWCSERATHQADPVAWPNRHILRASKTTAQPQLSPVGRCSRDHRQYRAASCSADAARGLRGAGA